MLNKLKSSIKHTAVYSLGNVATKLVGVVLLPLYTVYFTVPEFGVIGVLEITIMILTQVFIFGQSNAYLRFASEPDDKGNRQSLLFTIFVFLFLAACSLTFLGQIFAGKIASLTSEPAKFALYFKLLFYIVFLRVINNLFLSVLRANEKSGLYSIGNVLKIVVTLSLNVYFVAFAQIGISGILYAYIIGEAVLSFILLPYVIPNMAPSFEKKILLTTLSFGIPLIFASIAGMLLGVGDRFLLLWLVDKREVGLYDLGYRFAGLLNVILIQSFALGFLPQTYKIYGQKGDKRFFSKILTYFVFVLTWVGLGVSLFGKEIIEIFARNSEYWSAYKVIPIVVLAYVFNGARTVVNIGFLLKKKGPRMGALRR